MKPEPALPGWNRHGTVYRRGNYRITAVYVHRKPRYHASRVESWYRFDSIRESWQPTLLDAERWCREDAAQQTVE